MSVNSVSAGLLPSYGALSGNNSQTAKSVAFAKELPEKTSAPADGPQVTTARANDASGNGGSAAKAGYGGPTGDSQFQSELEQARRSDGAAAGSSASEPSGSRGGQTSAGIALYKRISQIGHDEPSASALLKRWNSIVQSEQDTDNTTAATSQAFARTGATRFESGILDLTA
jgi:hypothetical protein